MPLGYPKYLGGIAFSRGLLLMMPSTEPLKVAQLVVVAADDMVAVSSLVGTTLSVIEGCFTLVVSSSTN